MTNDWITTTDASKFSGYHPEHIRRLIREDKIKARKFGTVWQVDSKSITNYLANAENASDKRWGPRLTAKDR